MKIKGFLVEILLVCLTIINLIVLYKLNKNSAGMDFGVIVSMSVGGIFVILAVLKERRNGEGKS
ncbi:hypothetical protein [Guptibacillus spartinae]|uniref:hypothetical protein n=1 Tax=Guptibacillus spartinae TaxID=3025679 RepID=UPI00235ECEC3|nr:hypothetical protein [Pseudalkalibacillus spartinae]